MNKIAATFYFYLIGLLCFGQRTDPHSLAIGLITGPVQVDLFQNVRLHNSQLGINLNHQANKTEWFSWRTGFNATYLFPINYYERSAAPDPGSGLTSFLTGTNTKFQYLQLNLDLMPTLYYRDDGFNLFIGINGKLGALIKKYQTIGEFYEDGQWPVYKDKEDFSKSYFQVGWGPIGGIGFALTGKRKGGEIVISFSYQTYYDRRPYSLSRSMSSFAIMTSYRYYFKN